MSVQPIIEELKKTKALHQSLLVTSEAKTDCLKNGDTEQLQKLLLQERKHVQAISTLEIQRQKLVYKWALEHQMNASETTISVILEKLDDEAEKQALERQFLDLTDLLASLKQQEALNEQLIEQSLQFVELSIGMLDPQMQQMNYGHQPQNQKQGSSNRSLFDSKA